jgi:hypothetical protein
VIAIIVISLLPAVWELWRARREKRARRRRVAAAWNF